MECTVILPWPEKVLSPNSRAHRMVKYKAQKAAKERAITEAWAQKAACIFKHVDGPIDATITFYPPDRRRRDRDNMISSLKAAQDGLAHAVGADDSRWVPTYHVGDPRVPAGVSVTLRARDTGGTT